MAAYILAMFSGMDQIILRSGCSCLLPTTGVIEHKVVHIISIKCWSFLGKILGTVFPSLFLQKHTLLGVVGRVCGVSASLILNDSDHRYRTLKQHCVIDD